MVSKVVRAWPIVVLLVLLSVLSACGQEATPTPTATAAPTPVPTATPTPAPTDTVHMLIETSPDEAEWHRDVRVPQGYDAYQLTELVTKGEMKATWYPAYRSHFVESIMGVAGEGSSFWIAYLWDDSSDKWTSLPVGADWFSVKDGHTLAWVYTDTSVKPSLGPTSKP